MKAGTVLLCPCGKRGYRSAEQAKVANRHARFRFRVYTCPDSRLYHITANEKRGRDRGWRDLDDEGDR